MSKRNVIFLATAFAALFWWSAVTAAEYTGTEKMKEDSDQAQPNVVEPQENLTAPKPEVKGTEKMTHQEMMLQHGKQAMSLFPVERDGKWGYIDKSGKIAIQPKYEDAEFFSEGLARVKVYGKWGFIDETGNMAIQRQYENVGDFSDGLAKVEVSGKWGYIDTKGNTVIAPKYGRAEDFHEGLAAVRDGGWLSAKWAFIDKNGKIVAGSLGKEEGAAYREGATAPRREFSEVGDFSEGMARVKIDGKWGYIDNSGNLKVNPRFENAGNFMDGLANVEVDGRWGYIDKSGNFTIKPQFHSAEPFSSDGLALVRVGGMFGGKYGFIDKTGKHVITPRFTNAGPFSDGLARVEIDGKWGYIDKGGNFAIAPQYSDAWNFVNGVARVKTGGTFGGKWHYIDKSGKPLMEQGQTR